MTWDFVTVEALNASLLTDILHKKICGVRVPNYCDTQVASKLAGLLLAADSRTNYQVRWYRRDKELVESPGKQTPAYEETDTERVGLIDSAPNGDNFQEDPQLATPIAAMRCMRSQLLPYLNPIDRLRLELDEVLPAGANVHVSSSGQKASVGVGRIMTHAKGLVHADTGRRGCLTANVYLQLPLQRGDVRIWNFSGPFLESEGSYLFADDEIPSTTPSCMLQPMVGELVIWNPTCPHVVQPFPEGQRVSLQSWLKIDLSSDGEVHGAHLLN